MMSSGQRESGVSATLLPSATGDCEELLYVESSSRRRLEAGHPSLIDISALSVPESLLDGHSRVAITHVHDGYQDSGNQGSICGGPPPSQHPFHNPICRACSDGMDLIREPK